MASPSILLLAWKEHLSWRLSSRVPLLRQNGSFNTVLIPMYFHFQAMKLSRLYGVPQSMDTFVWRSFFSMLALMSTWPRHRLVILPFMLRSKMVTRQWSCYCSSTALIPIEKLIKLLILTNPSSWQLGCKCLLSLLNSSMREQGSRTPV